VKLFLRIIQIRKIVPFKIPKFIYLESTEIILSTDLFQMATPEEKNLLRAPDTEPNTERTMTNPSITKDIFDPQPQTKKKNRNTLEVVNPSITTTSPRSIDNVLSPRASPTLKKSPTSRKVAPFNDNSKSKFGG
jgi:hypothetical protein